MNELVGASAVELAHRLRRRELGALELVDACLARIESREPEIHAWTALDPERARARARRLDAEPVRGALHGLPIGVKDIIATADFVTAYGSPLYAGHRPARDAACVAAAEAAGAIVLGKTVTTEFATFTPGPTVNPLDLEHSPGGSSSGSAAAVADAMIPLAFATQTAGSIIRPASYCGIVGYKPSFGVLSRAGVKLCAESLDTLGALARTVGDAALFVGALAGRGDLIARPAVAARPRIAICRTPDWRAVDAAVATTLERAEYALGLAGADVVTLTLPRAFAALGAAHECIYGYELVRNLAAERAHPDALSGRLRQALEAGAAIDAPSYEHACALAAECRQAMPDVFERCDALLAPSATGEAPLGLASTGSPIMNRVWTLLRLPCVGVPAGRGPSGLPVGLQVVGRDGDDSRTLAVADWVHARLAAASTP
jgi:Asp-tRNA(Asn)/Glu-tRNA(Gln) amidotransferase A subunit family amidase